MKNFNDYIKREDFTTLQNFFIDRGRLNIPLYMYG